MGLGLDVCQARCGDVSRYLPMGADAMAENLYTYTTLPHVSDAEGIESETPLGVENFRPVEVTQKNGTIWRAFPAALAQASA